MRGISGCVGVQSDLHEGFKEGRHTMLSLPAEVVAHKVIQHIEPDGQLVGLALPLSALDPKGVSFWIRHVVGDVELATALNQANAHVAVSLIVERRGQCEQMLAERVLPLQNPG